jgi:glycosyltransferase involved in cell wall biosynthesis
MEKSSVEFISHVDHGTAIKYMMDSSALLLIIPDHQSSKSIITGKLFEYIASGKPVICLGPLDGDAEEIIKETGTGNTFNYNDLSGIETFLSTLINNPKSYDRLTSSGYSRKTLTSKLAAILNGL